MHEAAALRTKTAQIATRSGSGAVVDQSAVGTARRSTSEAVEFVFSTWRLPSPTPFLKKAAQFGPPDEERARFVDGLKTLSQPIRDGVLVNAKHLRRFCEGVATVDFDKARVHAACAHKATPERWIVVRAEGKRGGETACASPKVNVTTPHWCPASEVLPLMCFSSHASRSETR
jgi:hypothetical protein